ncbi:MAG: Bax inhibitor-1 family protein [Candidatus Eremiobacteraeota bacterium]|nr:Bax inhibitor-1 family protein [Candidatus Eremiobacteraeota bacterium]
MAYQYRQPASASGPTVAVGSLLGQVLGITGLGLVITALASAFFQNTVSYGIGLIAMIVGFVLLFVINAVRENQAMALLLFYVFTFLEGIGIAPVIGNYVRTLGPGVVTDAAATTGLGMFALAAIVYATGLDLRRFAGILNLALMGLIVVGIISIFTRWVHPSLYSWITLIIFTGYVLIDFARIRAGGDGLTPVQLAISIYLDAINIFLALLQLFGSRSRD